MVDAASGAEAMVEQLTETNEKLTEKLSKQNQALTDLEEAAELNEEIDVSQRAEISALRVDVDRLSTQLSSLRVDQVSLKARYDEVSKNLERKKEQCDELVSKCSIIESELASLKSGDVGAMELERQRRLAATQLALSWYSENYVQQRIACANLKVNEYAVRSKLIRIQTCIPSAALANAVGVAIESELQLADVDISLARTMYYCVLINEQYQEGLELFVSPDTENLVSGSSSEKRKSLGRAVIAKVVCCLMFISEYKIIILKSLLIAFMV
jgi:hypothetical protein